MTKKEKIQIFGFEVQACSIRAGCSSWFGSARPPRAVSLFNFQPKNLKVEYSEEEFFDKFSDFWREKNWSWLQQLVPKCLPPQAVSLLRLILLSPANHPAFTLLCWKGGLTALLLLAAAATPTAVLLFTAVQPVRSCAMFIVQCEELCTAFFCEPLFAVLCESESPAALVGGGETKRENQRLSNTVSHMTTSVSRMPSIFVSTSVSHMPWLQLDFTQNVLSVQITRHPRYPVSPQSISQWNMVKHCTINRQ